MSKSVIVLLVASAVVAIYCQLENSSTPSFLIGAPQQKIDEFQKLIQSIGSKDEEEVDKLVENWINQQDNSIKVFLLCKILIIYKTTYL